MCLEMAKMTKEVIVENLKGYLANAKKEVKEVIDYTINAYEENPRNITMADLKDTLEYVKEMLAVKQEVLPIENSLKVPKKSNKEVLKDVIKEEKVTVLKKPKKTEEEVLKDLEESIIEDEEETEEILEEEVKAKEEKPKKVTKKEDKPVTPKKEKVVTPTLKTVEVLASMPETLDTLVGKLKIRPDIKDIKELHTLIDDGVQLVICMYWNKRQLKQFDYDALNINPKKFTEFPNDLDIVDIMYASENGLVVYGVSLYTEVSVVLRPQEFATDPDTGLRYESGAEYQIYELVE